MLKAKIRSSVIFAAALITVLSGCSPQNQVNPQLAAEMPTKFLWAWERPEDLRFLDPKEFGVAFLAQTIYLEQDSITPKRRRVPLDIAPGTYVIAVTRIETAKDNAKRPAFDAAMIERTAGLIKATLELPDVKGVQVDFDAVVSERTFYRTMMNKLRESLNKQAPLLEKGGVDGGGTPPSDGVVRNAQNTEPSSLTPRHSLTMTSLASWCTGDAWFNDFPVDEAVPMVFQMGADSDKIKTYLRNGNDWQEPLCRGSYGISLEEGRFEGIKPGRRMYYFKNSAWRADDLPKL